MADIGNVTPDIQLPTNVAEQRGSAHYQEINYKYFMMMNEIYKEKYAQIALERMFQPREQQLIRFANPSYVYQERKLD